MQGRRHGRRKRNDRRLLQEGRPLAGGALGTAKYSSRLWPCRSSPVYTLNGGNVAILWGFKDNATLGFFKGVLLQDKDNLLVAPGDNSRSSRIFKFTSLEQIDAIKDTIHAYVLEAMELERTGARVDLPKDDIVYPDELVARFNEDLELSEAFQALTPGRRRGYALYFAQPKQSATRVGRIEKLRDKILAGKGLQDR